MFTAVLGLTLLGFGALIVAVLTGHPAWAWVCVGVCAVGVVLLVVDWVRERRGGRGL